MESWYCDWYVYSVLLEADSELSAGVSTPTKHFIVFSDDEHVVAAACNFRDFVFKNNRLE